MERVREVCPVTFAVFCREPSSRLRRLTFIKGGDHRRVGSVPGREELRSALFDPAIEVSQRDLVRPVERLLGGGKDRDRRVLFRYFFGAGEEFAGEGRELVRHQLERVVE